MFSPNILAHSITSGGKQETITVEWSIATINNLSAMYVVIAYSTTILFGKVFISVAFIVCSSNM